MKKRKSKGRKVKADTDAGFAPSVSKTPQDDWEAKDALRTLTRAHEIRANKGLMKRVGAHARRESESLARVRRLEGKPL